MIPQLIGLVDVTKNSVERAGTNLDKTAKLSLVLLSQFQIENLMRRLASALNLGKPESDSFPILAENILKNINLAEKQKEIFLKTLKVPAFIRNSLHANGIHNPAYGPDKNFKHEIEGIEYRFDQDEVVSCASWEHVAHAIEGAVRVIDTLLCDQKIRILGYVPDRFSELKTAE